MFIEDALRAALNFAQTENTQIASECYFAKIILVHLAYFPECRYFLCHRGFLNIISLHLRPYLNNSRRSGEEKTL